MSQGQIPADAQEMHARLDSLGVVSRVRRVLLNDDTTADATDLVCWVERDRSDVYVKVAYTRHRKNLVTGKPTNKHPDYARFRVGEGASFGPMGAPALPNQTVEAIQAMLPQ